jgi:hypothetical protein
MKLIIKIIKGFLGWIKDAILESINQVFTILGFFIAWLTLTGTARDIVGVATVAALAVWLITIPLRKDKE